MSAYNADHASALADIRAAGQSVTFTTPTLVRDPETRTVTDGAPATVTGAAIRVKGNPKQYDALGLTERAPMTLLVATDTFGDEIALPATVVWNGVQKKVEQVDPVAVDGPTIIARVLVAS